MKDTNQPKPAYQPLRDQQQTASWSEIRGTQPVPRVRIAYYCLNDPLDKRSWSGIPYYLGQALHKHIGEVDFLGPVKIPWLLEKTMRAVMKFSRFILRREYLPQYSLLKNKWAARYLKKRMKGKQYHLLVAPAAASELAFLRTDLPIVYFGDATFKAYSSTYDTVFKKVIGLSKWEGNYLEKRSLKKSSLVVLTSHWAAHSAMHDYGVPAGKIEVILLGASIEQPPSRDMIFQKEANKTLTLLFLAVDWERKGGAIAFATLEALHKMGIPARLVVCGVIPPPEYFHPSMDVIPFVDKNITEEYKLFLELFSTAHFLLLPTRADCTPVVNCESSAYGVPVITTDVGGVRDTVEDGVNGYCLPLEAGGEAYASLIATLFADKERHHQLIHTSRGRYEKDLNWDVWAARFREVLEKHAL